MLADIQLEEVAMALLVTLKDELPGHLADVEVEMVAKDAAWAAALEQDVPEPTLLPPPVEFNAGYYPTILNRAISRFPVCVVQCFDADPATADPLGADQVEVMASRGFVELVVENANEATINRMGWRYAKALHRTVARNETLGYKVEPPEGSKPVRVSNPTVRHVDMDGDEITYLCVCHLDFTFKVKQSW